VSQKKTSQNVGGQLFELSAPIRIIVERLREDELPCTVSVLGDGLNSEGNGAGGATVKFMQSIPDDLCKGMDEATRNQLKLTNGDPLGLAQRLTMRSRLILWAVSIDAKRIFVGNSKAVCQFESDWLIIEDIPPSTMEVRETRRIPKRVAAQMREESLATAGVYAEVPYPGARRSDD
jgi:hypothetical protein